MLQKENNHGYRNDINHSIEGVHYFQPSNSDLADLLHGVIGTLPVPQQEVVNLTFFEGLSQREIAARKSIVLGTVKTRLQLAHKKLFNQLASFNKIGNPSLWQTN
jgi:RNA polymerase sigma-70 factor, ECF subfamily